jgi:hypothetical protein
MVNVTIRLKQVLLESTQIHVNTNATCTGDLDLILEEHWKNIIIGRHSTYFRYAQTVVDFNHNVWQTYRMVSSPENLCTSHFPKK